MKEIFHQTGKWTEDLPWPPHIIHGRWPLAISHQGDMYPRSLPQELRPVLGKAQRRCGGPGTVSTAFNSHPAAGTALKEACPGSTLNLLQGCNFTGHSQDSWTTGTPGCGLKCSVDVQLPEASGKACSRVKGTWLPEHMGNGDPRVIRAEWKAWLPHNTHLSQHQNDFQRPAL